MTSTSPELKLKRFLHYGREAPLYQPGDRYIQKYFERDHVTCIEALLAEEKSTEIVKHIEKAYSDGYSAHPQSLVFALALCARQKNDKLRETAYNALKTVCKSAEDFFLFVKFGYDLSQPQTGWGGGMRRAISDWYTAKEPMELAECVSKYRSRHGWSHRDIIKLAHPKSKDPAKSAIFKYVIHGLEKAKASFNDQREAQLVLTYLQNIEDFKHCEDEQHAARLIEIHSLTLEHVPAHFLKSKEVWCALIPHLSLGVILQNLKRLGRLRFLRGNQPLVTKILDALKNQTAIAESGLHPAQVLVTLRNYENIAKPTFVQRTTEPEAKTKTVPQPHPKIVDALKHLLSSTFTLLITTGLRYLVAVDIRSNMTQGKCWHCNNVSPAQAAALMTLCLVKAEREVNVVAFSAEGALAPVHLDRNSSLEQAQEKLKEYPSGLVDLTQPLLWAKKMKKPVDVFLILTDSQVKQGKVKAAKALQQYRSALNLPKAKMIVCGLAVTKFSVACPSEDGMLDMAGFDGQVPRVIEAFSRGAF